jgi:hypothetical protein
VSDLPELVLGEKKRLEILAAINEVVDLVEPYQEGDVSAQDIMEKYGVGRFKARDIMKTLVSKCPNKYREVCVSLPGTYHNRPGYVIRAIN